MGPRLRFRVLGSGSTGNATLVEAGDTRILIDAGLGPRSLAERIQSAGVDPATVSAIFLTHEHSDHARGAAAFSAKWGVRLCGTPGTYAAAGFGAETIEGYDRFEAGMQRAIGSLVVSALAVPHDGAEPLAFTISCHGSVLGHATDLGHLARPLVEAFRVCDALLLESNYDPVRLRDGPYPWSLKERIFGPRGHLSNHDVGGYLAADLGESCRNLVLAHLSQKNNHPELVLEMAEASLRRRGKTEVRLQLTGPEGTDWIDVTPPPPPDDRPRQYRLF